ncbi:hypothetical protein CR983_00400 [Candidatus Saccharibacteria bacterium]|nr:MAG: hypothetical protein CR983_00400 [Candidatus Saccharibacteria bacterium]
MCRMCTHIHQCSIITILMLAIVGLFAYIWRMIDKEPRGDWRKDALCGPDSLELFDSKTKARRGMAKAICEQCPVKAACLEDALESRYPVTAVAGGKTPGQIKQLKAARKRVRAAAKKAS